MTKYSAFVLAALLIFAGCKEDEPVTPDRGRTFQHILNAAEIPTFDITFDYFNADDVVISGFNYKRNFPLVGYADMEAGGTPDDFGNGKLFLSASRQQFIDIAPDTVMEPMDIVLNRDEKSTIALTDSFGELIFIKYEDVFSFPSDTTAMVRFINLASGMPTASLESQNGNVNISGVAFMANSDFMAVPNGQHVVELKDTAGAVIGSQNLWIGGGTAYTFYLSGTNSLSLDHYTH